MTSDRPLVAGRREVLNCGGAGDTDMRGDETIAANVDVVRDLYKVIDFCSGTKDGIATDAAVDRFARTNLDVVPMMTFPNWVTLIGPRSHTATQKPSCPI